jgi:hypothetical protein
MPRKRSSSFDTRARSTATQKMAITISSVAETYEATVVRLEAR